MALPTGKKERKKRPVTTGVIDYFPDAIAEVALVSFIGNEQHNPGQPMAWQRHKSTDQSDCIARHLIQRGTIDDDGLRHSAKLAWRALALLQLEIEDAQAKEQHSFETVAHMSGKPTLMPLAYLAGPMTGRPESNFPSFDAAKLKVEKAGFVVISPADQDREHDKGQLRSIETYIRRNVDALTHIANQEIPHSCIVMLPGWQASDGAMFEYYTARRLKLVIRELSEFQ